MKNTLKNSGFLNGCVPSAGSIPAPGTKLKTFFTAFPVELSQEEERSTGNKLSLS